MKDRQQYSYVILRYVHDVLTAEFVNVGVVLFIHQNGQVLQKMRTTMGRLRGVFPDLDRPAFTKSISNVRHGLARLAKRKSVGDLFSSKQSILGIVNEALPQDDSSLQWSPIGGGFTANARETLDRVYAQFVGRYDTKSKHRRTDEEIWRPVMMMLEAKHIAQELQEKVIVGSLDDVTFKHAWKNGQWHVYEPVSFDLAEPESIKAKAREWLGHLAAVVADKNVESFKPYFFIGAPEDPKLHAAYTTAKKILQSAPNSPEVFEENQLDQFVAQIEDEVRHHHLAD